MRRGMPPGAIELSYLEKKVLLALAKVPKASPEEIRAAGKFRELVEVMNAASWLQTKGPDEVLLSRLAKGELAEDSIDPRLVRDLKSRRELVKEREAIRREIALTAAGQKVLAAGIELTEEVAQPTADLLRSGKWRSVDFRRYDTKAFAPLIRPGKRHVLGAYIERIRRIFLSMGFTEIQGDFVLSAFWNFD